MAVKVCGLNGCPLSSIFRGIAFAANNGADVINMSLGSLPFPKAGQKGFFHYYHLVVQYALVKGVSAVVVAAGNSAIDLDHDGNGFQFLCDVPGVICVSGTGPTDSGPNYLGPFLNEDAWAIYSNFGASAVNVAAPAGNISFDSSGNVTVGSAVWGACASTDRQLVNGVLVPGFCSGNGFTILGSTGTSGAAPHVAGLAALLVSQLGHGNQAQVRAAILNSADDRGKPGHDPFYGDGRINVARALGIQ
jgi:subtilisin family serine protease